MQAPGLFGSGKYWSIHNSQWSPIVFLEQSKQIPFAESHVIEFPLHSHPIFELINQPIEKKEKKERKKEENKPWQDWELSFLQCPSLHFSQLFPNVFPSQFKHCPIESQLWENPEQWQSTNISFL